MLILSFHVLFLFCVNIFVSGAVVSVYYGAVRKL